MGRGGLGAARCAACLLALHHSPSTHAPDRPLPPGPAGVPRGTAPRRLRGLQGAAQRAAGRSSAGGSAGAARMRGPPSILAQLLPRPVLPAAPQHALRGFGLSAYEHLRTKNVRVSAALPAVAPHRALPCPALPCPALPCRQCSETAAPSLGACQPLPLALPQLPLTSAPRPQPSPLSPCTGGGHCAGQRGADGVCREERCAGRWAGHHQPRRRGAGGALRLPPLQERGARGGARQGVGRREREGVAGGSRQPRSGGRRGGASWLALPQAHRPSLPRPAAPRRLCSRR